jgi:hypothetical protein
MSEAVGEPEMREVADGVFAYVQSDGGWCLNNAGLVLGESGALLVDTAATEVRARRLREAVIRAGGGSPRVVVNSHHHSDHTFGNFVFDGSLIVAQERCRDEMAASGYGLCGLFPDVEWGDLELVLPTVGYRDELTVHLGNLRVELIHPPVAAHTTNDTVVWAAIGAEDPGARVLPYMLSAGTDAKSFQLLGIRHFGFAPLKLPPELDFSALFHGVDERVPVDALTFGTRVLDRFLRGC